MSARRFVSGWGALRALVGVALLAWVISRLELDRGFLPLAAPWIALFAAYPFMGAGVEALRLRRLFSAQGMRLPLRLGVRLVLIAFSFNLFIPGGTGGDALKLYYLTSANAGRRVEIAALVLLDRALALLAMLLAGVIAVALSWERVRELPALRALGAVAVAAAAVGCAALGLAVAYGARAARANPGSRSRAVVARLIGLLARFRGRWGALVFAVSITLAGHAVLLTLHASAAWALLGAPDAWLSAALASLGSIANALPLTPGGIGVGEAAFDQLFALAGVAHGALLALAWRIGTLPASAVGFLLYGIGVRSDERALAAIDAAEPNSTSSEQRLAP